ncbi:MAG: (Fe-S)-binding protein [Chthonomonadaceae bacterium]|nr:(Fe-S)-binding protein [Chthonomonadaceae bacterium]
MKVHLMLTCLADTFFGRVGTATVRVLEHAGFEVEFPPRQTCCGQPAYNSGDSRTAIDMASHTIKVFESAEVVVTPSGSCAAMVTHGYQRLGAPMLPPVYELTAFLDKFASNTIWSGFKEPKQIALHESCHGRAVGAGAAHQRVLSTVPNLTILPLAEPEQCCGFGGTFSTDRPLTSQLIGLRKLECLTTTGAKTVVSGDLGCLMHLDGLARREGVSLEFLHVSEVLSSAI